MIDFGFQLSKLRLLQQNTTDQGDFNSILLFFTVLEGRKSKVKGSADSVLGEGPAAGLQTAAALVDPHLVQRGSSGVSSFLIRALIPS